MAGTEAHILFRLQASWAAARWCCCWIQFCALVHGQHHGSASRSSSVWLLFRWRAWRPGCTCCPAAGATWATTTKGAAHADTAMCATFSAPECCHPCWTEVLPACWDVDMFVASLACWAAPRSGQCGRTQIAHDMCETLYRAGRMTSTVKSCMCTGWSQETVRSRRPCSSGAPPAAT